MKGLAAALLLAFVAGTSPAQAQPPSLYVAMGESGGAGPMIPDQLEPLGCFRSDHNYAHLVAKKFDFILRDATCSSARITNAYHPQNIPIGGPNPPQLDGLSPDARVVTVDFGTNDSGNAVAFRGLLDDIHTRAPHAAVFVMGKIRRLPNGGCFPTVPIPAKQADQLEEKFRAVNAMLAATAKKHNAVFVDVYHDGHDACQPEAKRWAEGVMPESPAAPLHANARGHQAEADLLEKAMRASGLP